MSGAQPTTVNGDCCGVDSERHQEKKDLDDQTVLCYLRRKNMKMT